MRFRLISALMLLVPAAVAQPNRAVALEQVNPFLPPTQRQMEDDARIEQSIERAVAHMDDKIKDIVAGLMREALQTNDNPKLREALEARIAAIAGTAKLKTGARGDEPPPLPLGDLPALPNLPYRPGMPSGAITASEGAIFIGCGNGKAFFRDRGGATFTIDPKQLPHNFGAAACN